MHKFLADGRGYLCLTCAEMRVRADDPGSARQGRIIHATRQVLLGTEVAKW